MKLEHRPRGSPKEFPRDPEILPQRRMRELPDRAANEGEDLSNVWLDIRSGQEERREYEREARSVRCRLSRPVPERERTAFILGSSLMPLYRPMPLQKRSLPFDDPNWVFELKYDGFRALGVIDRRAHLLLSRNGHPFPAFADLAKQIAKHLPENTVLDGKIVAVDRRGKPRFNDILLHRRPPGFFAFDLLTLDGRDWRTHQLLERKQELCRLLSRIPAEYPLCYVDHLDGQGVALFERVCKLDLEGIVAKYKYAPYTDDREESTWIKILDRKYSQKIGREELFERDRQEPVPGWHRCAAACVGV
jgi:ATP-dependent DNA ligase